MELFRSNTRRTNTILICCPFKLSPKSSVSKIHLTFQTKQKKKIIHNNNVNSTHIENKQVFFYSEMSLKIG